MRNKLILATALAFAVKSSLAFAITSYTVDILATATGEIGGGSQRTQILGNQSQITQSFSYSVAPRTGVATWCTPAGEVTGGSCGVFEQNAGADVSGIVEQGALRAFAQARAEKNFSEVNYQFLNGTSGTILNQYLAQAQAYAALLWTDTLIFSSPTLPIGTAIDVQLGVQLHSDVSAENVNRSYLCTAGFGQSLPEAFAQTSGMGVTLQVQNDLCLSSSSNFLQAFQIAHPLIGQSYFVSGFLDVDAWAVSDAISNGVKISATSPVETVDASSTSYFLLDILTTGVSYMSGSGTVYRTAASPAQIPEPSSLTLLTSGLLVIIRSTRQRRRRGKRAV